MHESGASGVSQPGILEEIPAHAAFLTFRRRRLSGGPGPALERLAADTDGGRRVVGIGASLVRELGARIPGLRTFPASSGPGFSVPSTPAPLLVWLRVAEPGELVHETRRVRERLGDGFALEGAVSAFRYREGRDLTGYEDGTENPAGADAARTAIVAGAGPGLDGSSFAAVMQWVHDFDRFFAHTPEARDQIIGRRLSDNEELEDAVSAAHVRRTEQEAVDPPAFLLRRSMPWSDGRQAGLVFVSFSASADPFEHHLRRMTGEADGIVDHLFRFTRPVTGAWFWCPPVREGRLDLSRLLP